MSTEALQRFVDRGWSVHLKPGFSKAAVLALCKEASVLDIGCGNGEMMADLRLRNAQIRAVGLDISPVAIGQAQAAGLDCRVVDITQPLPFEDRSFEAVLLMDVLEHLFEPAEVLREAARVARKAVYISVPNFASLPARMQVLMGRVPENNTFRKGHVVWFTKKVLDEMLAQAGLKIDKVEYNTFWQKIPIVGSILKVKARLWPSLFALSFVIRAVKKN